MGVAARDISMKDFTFTQRALQSRAKNTFASARRLSSYELAVTLLTAVSMASYPQYGSAAELYDALKTSLTSSVSTGSFDTLLATAAVSYGSTSLAGATCSSVEVSDAIVTVAYTPSDGDANSQLMTTTIALGAALGVTVLAVAAALLFMRWKGSKNKVGVTDNEEHKEIEPVLANPIDNKKAEIDIDDNDDEYFSQAFFDKLIAESNDFFRIKPLPAGDESIGYEADKGGLTRALSRRIPQGDMRDEEEGLGSGGDMGYRTSSFMTRAASSREVLGLSPSRRLAPIDNQASLNLNISPLSSASVSGAVDAEEMWIGRQRSGIPRLLGIGQSDLSSPDLSLPPSRDIAIAIQPLSVIPQTRNAGRRRKKRGGSSATGGADSVEQSDPPSFIE